MHAEPEAPPVVEGAAEESRGARARRHGKRARLYAWSVVGVVALVVLIALVAANVRSVKVDWVFGSARASLVWVVLAAAVLGWVLGIATAIVFRFRTRRVTAGGAA
jgi:uncharacterized integral membrane protein